MDMGSSGCLWITLAALLVASQANGMTTLKAKYNMGGVTGPITFTQNSTGTDVTITLDLEGLETGDYTLQLHEFRVNYDTPNRCADSNVGAISNNWTRQIGSADATSGKGTLIAAGMDLSGTKSIEGRSFVVTNSNDLTVCATIEADTDYITAFAHLPASLGGTIIFRQKESSPSADTFMYLDLFKIASSPLTSSLRWQINGGQVKMDIDATTSMSDRCGSTILDLYDPDAASGDGCTTENHSNCKIGDLTAKHGNITIQTTGNTKLFFGDLKLPLTGDYSIVGKTIAFLNGDDYFACANILQYPNMEGVSKFSNDGVKGMIKFLQKSPLDPVTVDVNLDNLQNTAGGYHVHLFPVPQQLGKNQAVCTNDDVQGHFNPFNVDTSAGVYPAAALTTPDMYEVGDISGKFGTLADKTSYNRSWTDPNMQLYGKNSIIGRSIVIHKSMAGSPRWICSTIWPGENIAMTTAYARFTYPVIGYVILRQPKDMWFAETQMYVELNYAASGMLVDTVNHSWHIHEAPLGDDMLVAEPKRCQSVGPHYNPYSVYLQGDYSTECNSNKQLRCEVGDLSNKHGKLNIRTSSGGKTKFFFTDVQLPLSGPQSIVGKSIVIHDANSGAGRLSCGNVLEKIARTAQVSAWTAASGQGGPVGTITFSQDCVDILSCPTRLDVELSGLNDQVAGYHVHEYPTGPGTPNTDLCQGSDVGGHLNPLGAPYPLQPGDSLDAYEIGDLSGKFNPLTGSSYSNNVLDLNLPMEGPYSIVGRSIVIHKNDQSATRWACGNILDTTPGSKRIQAKAEFKGDIHGTIYFSQYKYTNGDMSDTYIVVDLKYKNGSKTTGHNWHVHNKRVTSNNCSSCGPHYNPYKVDVYNNYTECSMYNPLRCEMGDQSGKAGTYDIGNGKKFSTDINLNLEAMYSASKRSVVIHGANKGTERIACADIVPYGDSIVESDLMFEKKTYISSDIEYRVALSIGTSSANILVRDKLETIDCTTVSVYFLGNEKQNLQRQFRDVLRSNDHTQLGVYAPAGQCVTGASNMIQMSLLTVFLCLCLTKLQLL